MSNPSKGMPFGVMVALAVAIAVACFSGFARAETVRFPDEANARFSVTVTGEGPDVILIPGLGCSSDVWSATVEKFKMGHRLHVVNLAGFAGEPAAANASGDILPATVEALNAYIESNHLHKPAIVGHSLGGLTALMLGAAHPDAARTLVIVDAFPFIGTVFGAADVTAIRPQAERFRDTMLNATTEQFETMQRGMVAGPNPPPYGEELVGWTLTSDRRVMAQTMYEDMLTDVRPSLPSIKAKIVMIYPYSPRTGMSVEQADAVYTEAYKDAANVTMVRVDNSSHFIMLDQPEAFYTALEAALK